MKQKHSIIAGNPFIRFDESRNVAEERDQALAFRIGLEYAKGLIAEGHDIRRLYTLVDHSGRLDPIMESAKSSGKYTLADVREGIFSKLKRICEELEVDTQNIRIMGEGIIRASVHNQLSGPLAEIARTISPFMNKEEESDPKIVCRGIALGALQRATKKADEARVFLEYESPRTSPRIFRQGIAHLRETGIQTPVTVHYCATREDGSILVTQNWN